MSGHAPDDDATIDQFRSHRFERVREIVLAAAELTGEAREARLAEECGNDADLLREVKSLLWYESSEDPLFRTAAGAEQFVEAGTALPESVAHYRILSKLGEGGMGIVYEAEQENPKRKVALKLIRGGLFVDSLSIRLFQREAETLGRLQHPGIASIYESGRTPDGHHYFAMQLVQGKTLDDFLQGRPPVSKKSEREFRLKLFRQVCAAVAYAHQRGVIHRDLKPGNIIVDEAGEPHVLDFGLARIADGDNAAVSLASVTGQIKGTLPYMSPEQASGHPDAIDLRSDVYALGVILYEMLAGTLPYNTRQDSVIDALHEILEASPVPFQKLQNEDLARITGSDLETIVRKALEKEPGRRYQSADAFSDDLERYMANRPILARPPSTLYEMGKLISRNRIPFVLATALLLVLIAFGVWMSILFREADVARKESDAVVDFLSGMLSAVSPHKQGRGVTVREVLDEGALTIEDRFVEQPLVRARLMRTMGSTYRALGYLSKGEPLSREALSISEELMGRDHPSLVDYLLAHANMLHQSGDYENSEAAFERALKICDAQGGDLDSLKGRVFNGLANLEYVRGNYKDALSNYQEAHRFYQKYFDEEEESSVLVLHNIASSHRMLGNLDLAISGLKEAIAIRERAGRQETPEQAWSMDQLGLILMEKGDLDSSRLCLEGALAILGKEFGPENLYVAQSYYNMASYYEKTDEPDKAFSFAERALAIRQEFLDPDHLDLAMSQGQVALHYQRMNRLEEARELFEKCLSIREKAYGPESTHINLSSALFNVASILQALEDHAGSIPVLRRVLALDEKALGSEHAYVAEDMEALASALEKTGQHEEAAELKARAKEIVGEDGS